MPGGTTAAQQEGMRGVGEGGGQWDPTCVTSDCVDLRVLHHTRSLHAAPLLTASEVCVLQQDITRSTFAAAAEDKLRCTPGRCVRCRCAHNPHGSPCLRCRGTHNAELTHSVTLSPGICTPQVPTHLQMPCRLLLPQTAAHQTHTHRSPCCSGHTSAARATSAWNVARHGTASAWHSISVSQQISIETDVAWTCSRQEGCCHCACPCYSYYDSVKIELHSNMGASPSKAKCAASPAHHTLTHLPKPNPYSRVSVFSHARLSHMRLLPLHVQRQRQV